MRGVATHDVPMHDEAACSDSSGQGGQGRRLALPNEIFAIMGWDVGMKVKIKKTGKKVTVETYEGLESGSVEDED